MSLRLFAPLAWVGGQWAADVLLESGPDGCWTRVQPACPPGERAGAQVLAGPVLPGLVDAHSHAFQRAIAGLTERSPIGESDDFWSWRDRMYQAALRIGPEALEAIAACLYAELLARGYTHVCEFHYLHNDPAGRPYAQPAEMALALARAAGRTGIGLTLLPTLYMRAGFGSAGLREDQRRFASTPDSVLRIAEAVRASDTSGGGLLHAGVALHSLRAADEGALRETAQAARAAGLPVHIHIAEQVQEVEDCVRHHGQRPVGWLLERLPVDAGWNLVHATHASEPELRAARHAGAAVVLCPSTEANLGDGVFDLPAWLRLGGAWSVGSDSHVNRCWSEELRLLEYSQRFALRQRNVAARHAGVEGTAEALFEGALRGGRQAAGEASRVGGLQAGARADCQVLDTQAVALWGMPASRALDAQVFSSPSPAPARVFVGGREVHPAQVLSSAQAEFARVMAGLWQEPGGR